MEKGWLTRNPPPLWAAFSVLKKIKKMKKISKKYQFFFKTSNGAPWVWCAITSLTSNGAPPHGAPLLTCPNTECTPWIAFSVLKKIKENDGNVKKNKRK